MASEFDKLFGTAPILASNVISPGHNYEAEYYKQMETLARKTAEEGWCCDAGKFGELHKCLKSHPSARE